MNTILILSLIAALTITAPTLMLFEVKLADASSERVCVEAPGSTTEQNCFNQNNDCKKFIKATTVNDKCVKNK